MGDKRLRVLVAGGTGQTGSRVVERLKSQEHTVRVLSRSAERVVKKLGAEVEVHQGDVRDPNSLVGLGEGVDVAVITTGTRSYFGSNGGAAVDAVGNRNLVQALHGVNQIVFLSAFGLDRKSFFLDVFSVALNGYFRWKAEAEDAVRNSGVPLTIVRPVELRNRPAKGGALLNQAEPLSLVRTVSRDLVADVLVHCCGHPDALGKTFELCESVSEVPSLDVQLAGLGNDSVRPIPSRTPLLG